MTPAAASLRFSKYHAIGNDYLIVEEDEWADALSPAAVRRICDRHTGVGSDGILVRVAQGVGLPFETRILNPDGTEAEKSGNGLRIFARYLWDRNLVGEAPFDVQTRGGRVTCRVLDQGGGVRVDMGRAEFHSRHIPLAGVDREVLLERMEINREAIEYSAVTVGNPHCVIFRSRVCAAEAQALGPLIETEARFLNRTNVQFAQVIDRSNIRIEIWERGAGYTLASGSSSCAVAAVARRLGFIDEAVTIHMPGGSLSITVNPDFHVQMTGPVAKVMHGELDAALLLDAT